MPEQADRFVLSAVDWQTIVDALLEGVVVLDTDGRNLASNQAARRDPVRLSWGDAAPSAVARRVPRG
jgi:hypothetical protein